MSSYNHLLDGGYDWQRNGKSVREQGYTTDLIGSEMERLIRGRDKTRPFFGYVAFNAPHTPLEAPADEIERYARIQDPARRTYAAIVSIMDGRIGRLLGTLDGCATQKRGCGGFLLLAV